MEFFKGANAIRQNRTSNCCRAMVELTHRNTRRYGGYIVHMGIVLMFIGFTGAAFNKERTAEVAQGNTFDIGHYTLKVAEMQDGENDNYVWSRMDLDVYVGRSEDHARSARRSGSSRPATARRARYAIRRRLNEDLYVNYAGSFKRQPASGRSGVRVSAGFLGLDRLLGAALRHAGLPGPEQGKARLCREPK